MTTKYYKHDTRRDTTCSISSPKTQAKIQPTKIPLHFTNHLGQGWLLGGKGRYHLPRLMIHPMSNHKSYPPKTWLKMKALAYASKFIDSPTRIRETMQWSTFQTFWFATKEVASSIFFGTKPAVTHIQMFAKFIF